MTEKHEQKRRIIESFTGLRGLAVLFVALYHWWPSQVAGGYLGVIIFLTLSGYLVTDAFFAEHRTAEGLRIKAFFVRRIKRLYPPLLAFVFLSTTWVLLFQQEALQNLRGSLLSTLFGYNNWWQISQNLSYFERFTNTNLYTHLWTLSLELQFYLVWPFLFLLLGKVSGKNLRRNVGLLSLAGAVASALLMTLRYLIGSDLTRVYYGTDTRLFAFLLGAFLASGFSRQRLSQMYRYFPQKQATAVGLVATLVLILLMWVLPGDKAIAYIGGMLFFNLLLLIVMALSAAPTSLLGRLLANPVFCFLGERSYSLYLWQYPIMILTQLAFRGFDWPMGISVLFQLVFLFLMAELSYVGFEQGRLHLGSLLAPSAWKQGLSPSVLRRAIPALCLCLLCGGATVYGLIKAPAGIDPQVLEMKQRLEANQKHNTDQAKPTATRPISPDGKVVTPTESSPEGSRPAEGATPEAVSPMGQSQENREVIAAYPNLALSPAELKQASSLPVTAIGDSVLQMCANDLTALLPETDFHTEVGFQFPDGIKLASGLKQEGKLAQHVLFALGTNGVLQPDMIDQLATTFPDHTIYLMTIVTYQNWEGSVNEMLREGVKRHPNLRLIDWYDFAGQKADLFYPSDGTHPNLTGAPVYAQFVAHNILSSLGGVNQ